MAALQSHHDSRVNPYRYGVLEGNHTEDRFGLDLVHNEVGLINFHITNLTIQHAFKYPVSTMKDEYKWYNSVQFNSREKITESWPEEREAVEKDTKLKPFVGMTVGGKKQVSTVIPPPTCDNTGQSNLRDLLQSNGSHVQKESQQFNANTNGGLKHDHGSTLWNSELRNLKGELTNSKHSQHQLISSNLAANENPPVQLNVVESLVENCLEDSLTNFKRIEDANRTWLKRDPNNFTQYGGWNTDGLGDKSMYGICKSVKNEEVVRVKYDGDQEESCRTHLLFGHGLEVSQVIF